MIRSAFHTDAVAIKEETENEPPFLDVAALFPLSSPEQGRNLNNLMALETLPRAQLEHLPVNVT